MAANIITQVSEESSRPHYEAHESNVDYNSKIFLNVRGTDFVITRDELMSLPESILLCLFPNGVFLDMQGQVITNLTEDDIVSVNFDPACFHYIMEIFSEAQHDSNEAPLSPSVSNSHLNVDARSSEGARQHQENVLQTKPAIIVLREDLDYYVISPVSGLTADQIRHLKLEVASNLVSNKSIFSGLGFKPELPSLVHQTLGSAEQHLFDMLCTSGFDPRGTWGSRSLEPSKCVILSLLLVRLKSQQQKDQEEKERKEKEEAATPPDSPHLAPVGSNASSSSRLRSRLRIASFASSALRAALRSLSKSRGKPDNTNPLKLLLFWRKPARKCWWSNQTVDVKVDKSFGVADLTVKVHVRRVWTLELSVVGVQ